MKFFDKAIRRTIRALSWLSARLYSLQGVPVWRSFDGRVTSIAEMDDQHLDNTIAMLKRNGQAAENPAYPFLCKEQVDRFVARPNRSQPLRKHGGAPRRLRFGRDL